MRFTAAAAMVMLSCVSAAADGDEALLQLAEKKFEPSWTAADATLFKAIGEGRPAIFDTSDETPARDKTWKPEHVIESDRIVWLCTAPDATELVPFQGIQVRGARVNGEIDLRDASIEKPLVLQGCAIGTLHLENARARRLVLDRSRVISISARRLRCEFEVSLEKIAAESQISFEGAQIGAALNLRGASLQAGARDDVDDVDDAALEADRITVRGSVFCNGLSAVGEVRLPSAEILGSLYFTDARLRALYFPEENRTSFGYEVALMADEIHVKGHVYLKGQDGTFDAVGTVRLPGATIGGDLNCTRGHFSNDLARRDPEPADLEYLDTNAITASRMMVAGNVFFSDGFQADGPVRLVGATVHGDIDCSEGSIGHGMVLRQATVGRRLIWTKLTKHGGLDLSGATVGTLRDDEDSWPEAGKLALHGFVYEDIDGGAPLDHETRVTWLRRQPADTYYRQPYEQLAAVLTSMGRSDDATEVLIAREEDPARVESLDLGGLVWHKVVGATMRYGYRPANAGWLMLGLVVLGAIVFGCANKKEKLLLAKDKPVAQYRFNAFFYSLDAFVPLVDFHQAKAWLPVAGPLRYYLWGHTILGWTLTTLFVAGVTGLIR